MGMYSTFVTEDITITDIEGFEKLAKIIKDTDGLIEDGEIKFSNWDSFKLEGYWYKSTVEILIAIAPYIEGYAEFVYEEGYKFRIVFKDKKAYVQYCREVWNKTDRELL